MAAKKTTKKKFPTAKGRSVLPSPIGSPKKSVPPFIAKKMAAKSGSSKKTSSKKIPPGLARYMFKKKSGGK